jgi:hypothetical protein
MKAFRLASLAMLVVLTGCAASGPKFAAQEATTPQLKTDASRIYFYRPNSMMGAALQPEVQLDGKVVGKSQPGGYFYVDAMPGAHEAQTSTETTNKVSFVVDKGEVKYVRTKVSMGLMVGHVIPELVGTDEARKELSELSYTGAPAAN